MAKKEMYPIERKMTEDDLNRLIKSLERSTKMLKRLLFVKYRYDGNSVEEAAKRIDGYDLSIITMAILVIPSQLDFTKLEYVLVDVSSFAGMLIG